MIQIQLWAAFAGLVTLVSTAVFIVASYKRVNRETFKASNENWQVVVETQKEHIEALKNRIDDAEITQRRKEQELAAAVAVNTALMKEKDTLERGQAQLMGRNIFLYDLVKAMRDRMVKAGLDPGPEPNGMEGNPR